MMSTNRSVPRFTFLTFTDHRQRMLGTFTAQLRDVVLATATSDDIAPIWPTADANALTVLRLHGQNRSEIARSPRRFTSITRALKTVASLQGADDLLESHLVERDGDWNWYLTLFGTPMLVGTAWLPDRESADAALTIARDAIPVAQVATTATRLRLDAAGPLAIEDDAPLEFPLSNSGHPRRESGVPAPANLETGTRG